METTETFTTSVDLSKTMARIQGLIAQADHPNTGETEAATFRAKAEELMRKYRIDEEHLIATDQVDLMPILHELWLGSMRDESRGVSGGRKVGSYYQEWYWMLATAASHAGCEVHSRWGRNPETGEYGLFGIICGYEGDVRLAEMLYSSARLVFSARIEPKVDPTLSDEENCYRLRSAGITRRKVAWMLWSADTHAAHARVATLYKAECERRGEKPALDGRGVSAGAFRDAYAQSFTSAFDVRLRQSRDAADSAGGAITLHGRKERVREALWTAYPGLRPDTKPAVRETAPERPRKARRGRQMSQAEFNRLYGAAAEAGRAAGRVAAREIEINRVTPAKRVDENPGGTTTAGAIGR